jgi:hypothetical protein
MLQKELHSLLLRLEKTLTPAVMAREDAVFPRALVGPPCSNTLVRLSPEGLEVGRLTSSR